MGDSNGTYYTPLETQTDLVHTTYTGYFGTESQIIVNPSVLNEVLYKCFIPADIGGFTVRELGLFDAGDDLILICKLPAQDKFALDSGLYQPLTFTPKIIYTNPETQAVLTPSSQIIATQTFVNQQISTITNQLTQVSQNITEDIQENYYSKEQTQQFISAYYPVSYVSYSVNYGNCDSNGYANLINKVSDTEVSFKVGGIYPNMGITFPNHKHYEISEIPNVSALNVDTKYTFVIFKENLTLLENGTYRAIVTAVQIGYEQIERIPALTSASHEGYTATYLGTLGFNPYIIFDNNISTKIYGAAGSGTQTYYPAGNPDTSEGINRMSLFILTFDEIKNIECKAFYTTYSS